MSNPRLRAALGAPALIAVALLSTLLASTAAQAAPVVGAGSEELEEASASVEPREADPHPRLAEGLEQEASWTIPPHARALPWVADERAPVTVVVEANDLDGAKDAIAAADGEVTVEAGLLVEADVPPEALRDLSEAAGVRYVRRPHELRADLVSASVASTGAAAWQTAGEGGEGVTVAIVDLGFGGLAAVQAAGELPADLQTDFIGCDDPTGDVHGTAVAELVHDMAPAADLRLVCVSSDVGFASAVTSLPAQGVDIVNGSIGAVLGGRGDGLDGPMSVAVDGLRSDGTLYVASAGNYGELHYHAPASGDADGPELDDFVAITETGLLQFAVAPWEEASVSVKWDDWNETGQDFDVYTFNETCGLDGSEEDQSEGYAPPLEMVVVTNCTGETQIYSTFVNRYAGSGSPRMDFYFDGAVLDIDHVTASSIPEPATSPSALTVGAYCETNGVVETYSGRGPTIDGRIKPDLMAPDGVATATYGGSGCNLGFLGTSAAAPQVAGAAALILGANPDLDVAEVEQALFDRAADRGTPGRDGINGSGHLRLGAADGAPAPVAQPLTAVTPVRWFDSRPGTLGAAESAFGAAGRTTPLGAGEDVALPVAGVAGVPADATAVVLNVTGIGGVAPGWITVHPSATVPTASNLNLTPGQVAAVHVTATVGPDGKVRFFSSAANTHLVVDLAGWYGPTGSGQGRYTPLEEADRAFDSRAIGTGYAEGAFGPQGRTTPIGAGQSVDLQVAGGGGVPAGATAVVMNLTATAPTSAGWLTVYPTGSAQPLASAINFAPSQTVANLVVVPVSPDGRVTIDNARGATHVVVDVIGSFDAAPGGAGYVALDPPTRIVDTRFGNGGRWPVLPGFSLGMGLWHHHGVPSDVVAVLVSATAVSPTEASWFTLAPRDVESTTSNLNFEPGATVANAAIVAPGPYGGLYVQNARGAAQAIIDLAGYFVE